MSTTVGYSMIDPCSQCGESGSVRWVEVQHGAEDVVGMCLQCRGVVTESAQVEPLKPVRTCRDFASCVRLEGHHGAHRAAGEGLVREWWRGDRYGSSCPANTSIEADDCPECMKQIEAEEARLRAGGRLRPGQRMPEHLKPAPVEDLGPLFARRM